MTEATTTETYYFNSSIPVPDKAMWYSIGRLSRPSVRNLTIAVNITVPERALEFDLVQFPEKRKGHIGRLEVVIDASLKDLISVELVDEDLAELSLLNVEFEEGYEENQLICVISMPPPEAVAKMRIYIESEVFGQETSNQALCIEIDNVLGTLAPHQDRDHRQGHNPERPKNYRLHQVDPHLINFFVDRFDANGEKIEGGYQETFFYPRTCRMYTTVDAGMLVDGRDLVGKDAAGNLISTHEVTEGAHPNHLENIRAGMRNYVVPEFVPWVGSQDRQEYYLQDLPKLLRAFARKQISDQLKGGFFAGRNDKPSDFYHCLGANDIMGREAYVTYVGFGRVAPAYLTRVKRLPNGKVKREIKRDGQGEPIPLPADRGYSVNVEYRAFVELMASFLRAIVDTQGYVEAVHAQFAEEPLPEEDMTIALSSQGQRTHVRLTPGCSVTSLSLDVSSDDAACPLAPNPAIIRAALSNPKILRAVVEVDGKTELLDVQVDDEGTTAQALVLVLKNQFYEKYGLIFPAECFLADDWDRKRRNRNKRRRAEAAKRRAEDENNEESTRDDAEESEEESEEHHAFGDFGLGRTDDAVDEDDDGYEDESSDEDDSDENSDYEEPDEDSGEDSPAFPV